MPRLISQQVNIEKFPIHLSPLLPPENTNYSVIYQELTLGDLHGNALKLLFFLIKERIASGLKLKDYRQLVKIYNKSVFALGPEDLAQFSELLDKLVFEGSPKLVRLLGDELADRGSNDYFTLKILQKLVIHKVPVEILLSNHGLDFITTAETIENEEHDASVLGFSLTMLKQCSSSMLNMDELIEEGLIRTAEVIDIYQQCYKPLLKALSYILDLTNSMIVIYSHAGVGLETIQGLAQKIGLKFKDKSPKELAMTIDAINLGLQRFLFTGKVWSLYDESTISKFSAHQFVPNAPLEALTWNRRYDSIIRPSKHKNYYLFFCHGHDFYDTPPPAHVLGLNNVLGQYRKNNIGLYQVLITEHNSPLAQGLRDSYLQCLQKMPSHLTAKALKQAGQKLALDSLYSANDAGSSFSVLPRPRRSKPTPSEPAVPKPVVLPELETNEIKPVHKKARMKCLCLQDALTYLKDASDHLCNFWLFYKKPDVEIEDCFQVSEKKPIC